MKQRFTPVKIRLYAILLVHALIIATFVLMLLGNICPAELVSGTVEEPIVAVRESDFLCTGISQIVSDDRNIYVLFGNYGIVQTYTHDGQYQYSVSVCNHPNGRTEIAAHNNSLYVCDKVGNLFIFRDGTLVKLIEKGASEEIIGQVPFGVSDPDYVVRSGSVWFAPCGEPGQCVIARPGWLAIYQGGRLTGILFFLIIAGGVLLTFRPRDREQAESA